MLNKESTGFDDVLNVENGRARAEEAVASLRRKSGLWGKPVQMGSNFRRHLGVSVMSSGK